MKKLILILFIIVIGVFIISYKRSKSEKKSELKDIIESDKNNSLTIKTEGRIKRFPPSQLDPNRIIIKSFKLSPEDPSIRTPIVANIEIETKDVEGMKFYFIFYKNNKIVKEGEDNELPPDQIKKNDIIFCDAIIIKDGKEIKRKRSNYIKVLDLPPEIVEIRYPKNLNKPGPYKIYVKAMDPDKDELNFSVETSDSGLKTNIQKISPTEAEINVNLSKKDFSKNIALNIKVEDNERSFISQELVLNLKTKQIKIEGEKTSSEKNKKKLNKKEVKRGEGIPIRKIGF